MSGNIYVGLHEFWEMAFVAHLLRPADLFVDVGANAGSYTLLASAWSRADTVAVEPGADAFTRLQTNVRINGLDERVELHCCALGDHCGTVLFASDGDTTNHVVEERGTEVGGLVEVPLRTLDEILGSRQPVLVKIDVEGAELKVLSGATQMLQRRSLRAILVETWDDVGCSSRNPSILLLQEAGFQNVGYDPWTRKLTTNSDGSRASNLLFVRDPSWVAARLRDARPLPILGETL